MTTTATPHVLRNERFSKTILKSTRMMKAERNVASKEYSKESQGLSPSQDATAKVLGA